MWKVLANDGLHQSGIDALRSLGIEVHTDHIPQEELSDKINEYDAIIVRSATKVRQDLIAQMNNIKLIIRAGVGLDNIDLEAAEKAGIEVRNTPSASSRSVAELAIGHLLCLARGLHSSNRLMPTQGDSDFKKLKKKYSRGQELEGKKLGLLGFGRIGKEMAKLAIGMGMDVVVYDPYITDPALELTIAGQTISVDVELTSKENLLAQSDFISLHMPGQERHVLGREELEQCKWGVILVNAARGGLIDEEALEEFLDSDKVAGAALDVFVGEPVPSTRILGHKDISLSPHIGASTVEAQEKIALECVSHIRLKMGS